MPPKRKTVDKGKQPMMEEERQITTPRKLRSGLVIPERSVEMRRVSRTRQAAENNESQTLEVNGEAKQARIQGDRQMAKEMQVEEERRAQFETEALLGRPLVIEATPMMERRLDVGPSGAAETPTIVGVSPQLFMEVMNTMMGLLQAMKTMMGLLQAMKRQLQAVQPRVSTDPSMSTVSVRQDVAVVQGQSESTVGVEARERERRQEALADMRAFQELNPPSFSGDGDYVMAFRWVSQMEKLFYYCQCEERVKVKYATFMFRDQAKEWWQFVRGELPGGGNELMWLDFLRMFYGQFFPNSEREKIAEEFAQLVQGRMTVDEYDAKFRELSIFAFWVALDPREQGQKFQRGLRPSIRKLVALLKLEKYADILDRARLIEYEEERSKIFEGKRRPQGCGATGCGGNGSGDDGRQKKPRYQQIGRGGGGARGQGDRCYACGQIGHRARDCSVESVCYKCGQAGHLSRDCMRDVACYQCGQSGHTRAKCPYRALGS